MGCPFVFSSALGREKWWHVPVLKHHDGLADTGETVGYAALSLVVSEEKCTEAGQVLAGSFSPHLLLF